MNEREKDSKGRLLIIDSGKRPLSELQERFDGEGYMLTTAGDIEEGFYHLFDGEFDVVLLDEGFLGEKGIDPLKEIRRSYPSEELPVIILASSGDPDRVFNAMNRGASDFIFRPLDIRLLSERIHIHLTLKRAREKLAEISTFDPETGLPNRRLFETQLEGEISRAERYGREFGLISFRLVPLGASFREEDAKLHDNLAVMISRRLRGILRSSDILARTGKSRFSVILPETSDRDSIEVVMEKIAASMKKSFFPDTRLVDTEFWIGSALYPGDGATVGELILASLPRIRQRRAVGARTESPR